LECYYNACRLLIKLYLYKHKFKVISFKVSFAENHWNHISRGLKRILKSLSLRGEYINITVIIINSIHLPLFYLKHCVSKTGFCLRLHVVFTHLGPINRPSPCIPTTRSVGSTLQWQITHFYKYKAGRSICLELWQSYRSYCLERVHMWLIYN
jgi:hypothetical protein